MHVAARVGAYAAPSTGLPVRSSFLLNPNAAAFEPKALSTPLGCDGLSNVGEGGTMDGAGARGQHSSVGLEPAASPVTPSSSPLLPWREQAMPRAREHREGVRAARRNNVRTSLQPVNVAACRICIRGWRLSAWQAASVALAVVAWVHVQATRSGGR